MRYLNAADKSEQQGLDVRLNSAYLKKTALAVMISAMTMGTTPVVAQQDRDDIQLEEVIVTGTYLARKRQGDLPSPTTVLGASDLNEIGAANVADIVQNLTINNGSQNNPDAFTQNGTVGSSNFNLRGLGVASTLVLLNGRRQVSTAALTNDGVNFVDTNALIPQIAIKRLEIVKDGAAAIYGTDAVAGVVNFITDNDFKGSAVNVRVAGVDGEGSQSDTTAEVKFGWGTDNTDIVVAASYFDRSPLTTAERRLSRPQDDSSSLGNPGSFFLTGIAGGALPLIDPTGCESEGGIAAPLTAFQPLLDGAGLPFRAGLCQFDFGDFFNLVPEEERYNLFGTVTHRFGNDSEFRFEAAYTDYEAIRGNSPSFPFLQTGSAIVPANNPGNVFPSALGTAIFFGRVSGNGGTVSPSTANSETLRLSAELSGSFLGSENWDYDVGFTYGNNEHVLQTEDTVTDRLQAALFGFGGANCNAAAGQPGQNGCLFFNPFATSFNAIPNDPALLDFLIDTQTIDSESELIVLDGVLSGIIGSTAAGEVGLAVGAQYRREDFTRDFDDLSNQDAFAFIIGSSDFGDDRDIFALFTEIAVPITPALDFTAAVRYEDYGGSIGDTVDPKVSLLYRPSDNFSVRASFSTSFRAPSQFQVSGQSTSLQQVNDPLGGTAFAAIRSFDPGAGRNIQPEESQAFNFGFSFSPAESLDIGVDYWSFDFSDAIIQTAPQAIVDADPTGPSVIRGPGGNILFVFNDFVNASNIDTDGIDVAINYDFETSIGRFAPFLDLTRVFNYDIVDPQAGIVEGAGSRNFSNFGSPTPETRFTLGVNYIGERINARLAHRSVSSFDDDQNDNQQIDSFDTVDAQVNVLFGSEGNISATIGVTNLTDEEPPQVFTNGGFESRTHDPRGRIFYAQVGLEF